MARTTSRWSLTMADRCICCDLPIESCGKAVEDHEEALEREVRASILATPGWRVARYSGTCMACRQYDFAAGEPITQVVNVGWAAGCCFDEIEKERVHK
jgi:hypothetical protein